MGPGLIRPVSASRSQGTRDRYLVNFERLQLKRETRIEREDTQGAERWNFGGPGHQLLQLYFCESVLGSARYVNPLSPP